MSTKKISELETTSAVSTSDLMETAIPSGSSYASKKMSIAQLATYLENSVVHSALDTQNKTIIDAINELKSICDSLSASHFIVANQLPTSDINMNAIYLIPKQSTGVNDVYEEYICLDDTTTPATWEKIGETQIDLSNYISFDDADIATKSKNGSMSKADRIKMNGIESGAQKNVQSDWNASSGDAFIKHKPTIPSALADLTDDRTHRVVTDLEKSTWNDNRAVSEIRLTNEDLDNVTTVGFYYAAGGNTCANKPTGYNNFGLVVIHNASGSQYTQIISNENGSYRRIKKADGTWTSWAEDKFTDENVKQTEMTDDKIVKSLAIASDNTTTADTDGVEKCNGLAMRINKNPHSGAVNSAELYIGNNIAVGSADNYVGVIRMFGTHEYYTTIHAGNSTDNREIVFPDADGTVALKSELPTEAVEWSEMNVLGAKNLLPYPYYYTVGANRGVNYEMQEDGGIYLHGTNNSQSSNSYIYLVSSAWAEQMIFDRPVRVSWSGTGTGLEYITLNITKRTGSSGSRTNVLYLESDTEYILAPASNTRYDFEFSVTMLQSVDAYVYPMVRYADVIDDVYAPPAKSNRELSVDVISTLSQLATYESSNSASQAYAIGDYMVWKGKFYRVKQAISSGGTITLNTNVEETTLGAELKRALT